MGKKKKPLGVVSVCLSMLRHSSCQHTGSDCKDMILMIKNLKYGQVFLLESKEFAKLQKQL